MKDTQIGYIPHSKIIGITWDLINGNSEPCVRINTLNGNYYCTKGFITDSNGITGEFNLY